jgi:Zn-dependent protease
MAVFLTVTVLWVFSVCLHEFGHALVAYRGGDTTVVEKGYLTLNPLAYTHPVYSLLMPVIFLMLGGIGLPGGAVYIQDHLLRSKGWRTGVSLAGPAMNAVIVVLIALGFRSGLIPSDPENGMSISMAFLMVLEISSIVLCLLPIPPLDGFRAISPWLSPRTEAQLLMQSNAFLWGLFIVLWYVPAANRAFWGLVHGIVSVCGVDPYLVYCGWEAFRFWQ